MNPILHALGVDSIASAAIKFRGKQYTGQSHFDAIENAIKDVRKEGAFKDLSDDDIIDKIYSSPMLEEGFVTARGKFLSREQALALAEESGQVKQRTGPSGRLWSEDLKP